MLQVSSLRATVAAVKKTEASLNRTDNQQTSSVETTEAIKKAQDATTEGEIKARCVQATARIQEACKRTGRVAKG